MVGAVSNLFQPIQFSARLPRLNKRTVSTVLERIKFIETLIDNCDETIMLNTHGYEAVNASTKYKIRFKENIRRAKDLKTDLEQELNERNKWLAKHKG